MLKEYTIEDVGPYGCIYKLTSPSGKCYVGQSWNIKNRFNVYKNISKCTLHQIKLYRALKKYGSNNFKYEILDLCESQIEMDNKECFYMEIYNSIKSGYNCREGGSRGKLLEAQKIKMSISRKGKKLSEDHKNKIKIGINNRIITPELSKKYRDNQKKRKNFKMSDEAKKKLSIVHTGKKQTEEHIENMKKSKLGFKHSEKTIEKFKYNTRILKTNCIYLYKLYDFNNNVHYTKSLKEFCILHNLNTGRFWGVVNKKKGYIQHKGWTGELIPRTSENEMLYEEYIKSIKT